MNALLLQGMLYVFLTSSLRANSYTHQIFYQPLRLLFAVRVYNMFYGRNSASVYRKKFRTACDDRTVTEHQCDNRTINDGINR